MNFEKCLQAGLISLCALALFGCAGMADFLSQPVTPEKVPVEDGLQSKLQKKKIAMTNAAEIAKYQATLVEAVKKDCQAKGSEFSPAPSTGLATNKVSIPRTGYYVLLSENERTKVLGIIDRGYRYVLLPEYLYFCDNGSTTPRVLQVPYSRMYNSRKIMGIASGADTSTDDFERIIKRRLTDLTESPIALPKELEAEFQNVYSANTQVIQEIMDESRAAHNAPIIAKKAKEKAEEDAQWAAEQKKKREQKERNAAAKASILNWDDAPAKARADAMKNKTIVFKSLYLGMPIEDAHHLLFRVLDVANDKGSVYMSATVSSAEETRDIIQTASPNGAMGLLASSLVGTLAGQQMDTVVDGAIILHPTEGNLYAPIFATKGIMGFPEISGFVEATPDGKVTRIVLGETVVNILFSADKMDASTFADQFVKFYNVPRMMISDDLKTWNYMRADGVKLSIYTDGKILTLEKATGQKDLKKSFD